ncbi:DUF4142 domain-containing protein [Sphingomonas sp. PB4P5]|uniref:DUF4142 domain-containing protein n=1 Tax=Parasphingomonas puruogangriensis TaxID=3096155 RepID=UPI002FC8C3A8
MTFKAFILASVLVAGATPVLAQTPPPPPPAEAKAMADPYVMAAGKSDLYEINSSQIALQKSRNPRIRSFASMLIKHHQKTTLATMKAARREGMNPAPPMLDPGATASINELQTASAGDFDRLYIGQQIPAHQAARDLHQSYGANGDKAALRTAARAATPIVKQHLTAAMKLHHDADMGPMKGM